jgi:hypothetical protein
MTGGACRAGVLPNGPNRVNAKRLKFFHAMADTSANMVRDLQVMSPTKAEKYFVDQPANHAANALGTAEFPEQDHFFDGRFPGCPSP